MHLIITGILMGLGGTLAMDAWALVANRIWGLPLPDWAYPGRWFGHGLRGRFFHADIAAAPPVPNERALGWALHYGVGVSYGVIWALIAGQPWLQNPTFLPVWIFALLTIAAGWFLLHPGMGLGWAAARTPSPWKVRALGLVAHTMFGLGMWAVALLA